MKIDSRVDPELAPALDSAPDVALNHEILGMAREFMEKMTADANAQAPRASSLA